MVHSILLRRFELNFGFDGMVLSWFRSYLTGRQQYPRISLMKMVQNAAARLVVRCCRQHHITPALYSLHWLPVSCRIQYKVSSLCHCSLSEGGPRYLSELLYKYTPSRQLRSSSNSFMLCVPTTNRKTFGERSFSFTGPTAWNSLPYDIRFVNSAPSFRQALKTRPFKSYFESN